MSEKKRRTRTGGRRGGVKHRERVRLARLREAKLRAAMTDLPTPDIAPSPITQEAAPLPNLSALRARLSQFAHRRAG